MEKFVPPVVRPVVAACAVAAAFAVAGCSSLSHEGAAAGAGVVGAGLAATITKDPAITSGIGLGVLAAADAGVKKLEKDYHGDQQDQIAGVAGPLAVGQVGHWKSVHRIELEPNAAGRVTVSRVISATGLSCKEIVFSVDHVVKKTTEIRSSFFVATICKDASGWRWASAEPATPRWGSLQ